MASYVCFTVQQFRLVPPAAVPAMLDCVLASTGLSPSLLCSSLLDAFLISPSAHEPNPFVQMTNGLEVCLRAKELLKISVLETADSFFDVVIETNSWGIVEATMVPFFLRLVGLSMGMLQSEELAIYGWSRSSVFLGIEEQLANSDIKDSMISDSVSFSFPLDVSCYSLISILDSTLRNHLAAGNTSESSWASGSYAEKFAKNFLWDLCNMTVRMLLQSIEHRYCAIKFLLPNIFKAFASHPAFEITVRKHFFEKIWPCCRTLFSMGPLERRDSYNVLSLYFSFFSCTDGCDNDDASDREEGFDIRAEKEFWDEIKKGLKQSLHILKMMLQINEGSQCYSGVFEMISSSKTSMPNGLTKKGRWADMEAKSLGVGKICNSLDPSLNSLQKWEAFFLLYEMLEEYGTHLVEAAWNHQSRKIYCPFCYVCTAVRCLIMESFLGIEWKNYRHCAELVPEDFVLGPFIQGLNDPVHHKDFGIKGIYSSRTIEGATKFMCPGSCLNFRKWIAFLINLASTTKKQSFGRAGLMGLVECIASAACGVQIHRKHEVESCKDGSFDMVQDDLQVHSVTASYFHNDKEDLLDVLRYIIESSKQHFNPNYRLRGIYSQFWFGYDILFPTSVTKLWTLLLQCRAFDVSLEILLHFISAVPQEFTDCGGSLRVKVQEWLSACDDKHCTSTCCSAVVQLWKSLCNFPRSFIGLRHSVSAFVNYDDEDLDTWGFEAKRWARVVFLVIKEDHHVDPILTFIQTHGIDICKQNSHLECIPVKFLILALSLIKELQIMQEREWLTLVREVEAAEVALLEIVDHLSSTEISVIIEKFSKLFLSILEGLVAFATSSCSIFLSSMLEDTDLPRSLRGKLGGPSQRRLSPSATTAVLQAIMSMKAVASISLWCVQFESDGILNFAFIFLWKFFWKIVSSSTCDSETAAEIWLAAYEALAHVLKAVVSAFSSFALDLIMENHEPSSLSMKWICLEYLLSILAMLLRMDLENAGEGSVLPMLRSIRLVLELFNSGSMRSDVSSRDGMDTQMMWHLVRSSWILHVSCNKRRVAPIAALLSSVLHYSVFSNECMHQSDNGPGPLKWFVGKILEEGTKSPRTIRLAALHLTGLWLLNPKIIKYYMQELKLLTLYGSVAFDEDFEAELAENYDARKEVSLLSKSPDLELTEAFINTELYARVSVAVLFYKLADFAAMVGLINANKNCHAALESGKMFLLELLDFVVNDKDQAKELYKKYSGKHYIINIYLKFPSLVREQLVPIFRDYDMRPQALSSYVFIAANVILNASATVQSCYLVELIPPIIPLLTSHHHSLRGFTQLLVYQVLFKLLPSLGSGAYEIMPLEKSLRASMEGFLDAFNPKDSVTPAGIFSNRVEELQFECVPTSLMEQVTAFLNDVREDLRCSMAKDAETIKNESLSIDKDPKCVELSINADKDKLQAQLPKDIPLDFQKKVIIAKHEKEEANSDIFLGKNETYKRLMEMEKEDQLFDELLHSRSVAMEKIRGNRQQFILVASLLDRIPNLAGLARTCEVFKAAGLAVADANIVNDKQFQLISVTADKWVPIVEVPVSNLKVFLQKKKREGFSILGLEQTANSIPLDQYIFPKKTVLVLGREKEGIPAEIIHILDACIEIPQLGVVRSLNVHVSGAIALWEYTRQQRSI
ncbi:putative methyltransferase TARBP1 [Camellia lanceoleosa]|uniref:Methyltransferase TARBP1 n=1 Tax=Camellia lanceoleosa TaxID=1840588 RepID=A0ACC0FHN9_9ERIC|nr:putative methyltransferase TARBP1 [Camellia lanceoleosa]